MSKIVFVDTETDEKSNKLLDIGACKEDGSVFHKNSLPGLMNFISGCNYIIGHNFIKHDLKYVKNTLIQNDFYLPNIIDTLYLSPLLFPAKPYHALLKDDKLQTGELNNPVNDAKKARDLFHDEVETFKLLDSVLQIVFFKLLRNQPEFQAFFCYLNYSPNEKDPETQIRRFFKSEICEHAPLAKIISNHPVELTYCLALINCGNGYSITPPWVLKSYPIVENIMMLLRNKPCIGGCDYCNIKFDIHQALKRHFGFDGYRTYNGEALQEKAVQAAVNGESLLTIFPTGGGKSVTFQIPALIAGDTTKGLTVVISPLQSLMKDQVDNLEKIGITSAVTINGLLDPIERSKSIERVQDGSATILYIAPESLRSITIEKLLLGRKINRFVVDEAHCFSSWGQDFRVDYLYIGNFIKILQEKKNLQDGIPVSCFTATAKLQVIQDIKQYFEQKLGLNLLIFRTGVARRNLHYQVLNTEEENDKYFKLRSLIESNNCPTIVYVSRTKNAEDLAFKLNKDGFDARSFHGKMEARDKSNNQNAFIAGEVQIMVATSAFGMGVDKKDVGLVIHYEISDSLENYVQEAGRAGRDEKLSAQCYVLFNEEDLDKHFILLNQTKLQIKEIQQVWKAIKDLTRTRSKISNSALEIARKAGWVDNIMQIETRVTTSIAALEEAGYLKRMQNKSSLYASSILCNSAQEAIDKIKASSKFAEPQKEKATRIIKKLFSSRSRVQNNDEEAESRVDYISDHLGLVKKEVIDIISLMKQEKILADTKDLTAYIRKNQKTYHSQKIVKSFNELELLLLQQIAEPQTIYNLKEFNQIAEEKGLEGSIVRIKQIVNLWSISNLVKIVWEPNDRNHFKLKLNYDRQLLEEKIKERQQIARFIVHYLYGKIQNSENPKSSETEFLVEFSEYELKEAFEKEMRLFNITTNIADLEAALLCLSRIEAINIEGGFFVIYNRLQLERIEQDNKKRYKLEDYDRLHQFYESRVQQIHIVGEYAKRMVEDTREALQFVDDYFQLNYSSFLQKYFNAQQQEDLRRNITPAKFKKLFGTLSATQLKIINDQAHQKLVVAAGPGSGKTRILVHKLASLMLMEDVKSEQLLMITFSRAAANEFKKRLIELIGNAALFIAIKTFHSYCFDLLGKVGSLEKSDTIIKKAVDMIRKGEIEISKITKTVLVIDEAQDMNVDEFALVQQLMHHNEDLRMIAVGDDDQNIYEFRGSSSKYLEQLLNADHAGKYELVENYRSKSNLVQIANQFVQSIGHRLKSLPIIAKSEFNGNLKLVRYNQSANLASPLVSEIIATDLAGSTIVLTRSNEEAAQITGLLVRHKCPAKLIQTNDGFNLFNLFEVREFYQIIRGAEDHILIPDKIWAEAKNKLRDKFSRSDKIEICLQLIREFEIAHPKRKYRSDFESFVRDSSLEDFISSEHDTILVSTIHKAKGSEFDNVFILLENFELNSDSQRRLLYVALTRAKNNLYIHTNSINLDYLTAHSLKRCEDKIIHQPPDQLVKQLTHRDVWLDFFKNHQSNLDNLMSGDLLISHQDHSVHNQNHEPVLKFSNKFLNEIKHLNIKGYRLQEIRVNFILYWKNEKDTKECKIILPEVHFSR